MKILFDKNECKYIESESKNYEFDASIEAWNDFYLKVYSKIDLFKNNFDFSKPKKKWCRIVIAAKEDSELFKNFKALWNEMKIPGEPNEFLISGDCDFYYKGILNKERHQLLNLSLMPVTGGLNDEKGSKGSIKDIFSEYIRCLPNLIDEPHSIPGNYGKLSEYKMDIVKCARKAYFQLFNDKIEEYFYTVNFFEINKYNSNEEKELFEKVKKLLYNILNKKDIDEKELANEYWKLRQDILNEKYGLFILKS